MLSEKYGRWKVIKFVGFTKDGHKKFQCKCKCGMPGVVSGSSLVTGTSKSCGCLREETFKKKEFRWRDMAANMMIHEISIVDTKTQAQKLQTAMKLIQKKAISKKSPSGRYWVKRVK